MRGKTIFYDFKFGRNSQKKESIQEEKIIIEKRESGGGSIEKNEGRKVNFKL